MVHISKKVLVKHSAQAMFELVDNVADYPLFLPWCSKTEVIKREGNILEAMLHMDYMKIKQAFGTRNINTPNEKICMNLLDGPFKHLDGCWQFVPMGEKMCKVHFDLHYEFSNAFLSRLIGPVFSHISGSLVGAFITEANRRYG